MEQIRERIERDEYAVDPQKVAAAIVRRLESEPSVLVAAPRRG